MSQGFRTSRAVTTEPIHRACLLFALCLLVVAALPASGATSPPAKVSDFTDCVSTATTVCLRLWTSGYGRIEATPEGGATTVCDYSAILGNERECPIPVARGSRVVLSARPEPVEGTTIPSQFLHWSRFECQGTGSCTFTAVDDDEWVVAVFSPVKLELDESGDGTVAAPGLTCPAGCVPTYALFPAEQPVTVTATPAPGNVLLWHAGCEPAGGNFASSTCTVAMTNIRNFATVAFGPPNTELFPPDFPFQISVGLKVKRSGTGSGTITGGAIDCGARCSDVVGFQTRITLKADASTGSRFVRWVGVCGTEPTCRFSAGSVTTIGARFDRPPKAKLLKVRVKGTGGRRMIVIVLTVDSPARLSARLLKRAKVVARNSWLLPAGRTTRRLRVRRAVKPGKYRLTLKFVADGGTTTLTRRIKLRR